MEECTKKKSATLNKLEHLVEEVEVAGVIVLREIRAECIEMWILISKSKFK